MYDPYDCQTGTNYTDQLIDKIQQLDLALFLARKVLRQMMTFHRGQLPSEVKDLYGGGCGCPLCQAALDALKENVN